MIKTANNYIFTIILELALRNPTNPYGNCMYQLPEQSVAINFYFGVLYNSHCKQRLYPETALTS
jgi:hypothetical protein